MNSIFLLDPPSVQSVSQRQSQIKGTLGVDKLPVVNITFTTVTGITVVASIGFILTVLVCSNCVQFYNNPLGKISILLLFGMHFSSFYFNRT